MTETRTREKRYRSKKKMKRWVKWLIIVVLVLFLLVIAVLGYGYWYIKSVSLDDIKSRHQPDENGTSVVEPVKIPGVLEGAVDKAAGLVGKDIEGQDALDVASILLNSGLSLREIKYLQGTAAYDLTTEEKQRIRDLLLEKLKPEEIELLRSITSKYGKTLRILDSDFPIEWVGERDPEKIKEYDRKWDELKKNKAVGTTTNKDAAIEGKEGNNNTGKDSVMVPDKGTDTSGDAEQLDAKATEKKTEINAKYDQKLASLKSTCTAKSNTLLNAILADLDADPKASLSKLQAKFLGQLADAEATCDSQFSQLQAQAKADYKAAGIPATSMPNWKSEYDKAKVAARSAGISAIMKQMNGK
ncbi:hypothetical protein PCCS19_11980 [Paenibacillus sp. CCS19]|uniref:hypothetical protein n=1 Tax=Paenibacillus sp. CCS19 TaxID=3158387 RepID=UPI00256C5B07|nr:hypothetical protein [Paenibacillus cellulosilyticus]GMK38144.1 hypothetical protein PCCS19_11980 [Paenibacillus cellulosilyticus]